jgi:pimeloyl-ACP methyl ester carboxylesterase
MTQIVANGIALEFDLFGKPGQPIVLVIGGFLDIYEQWSDELCRLTDDAGFTTLRFDTRDCGRSARVTGGGTAVLQRTSATLARGAKPPPPPYTLHDLAADALALMDALGIDTAHVIGFSMGGNVAQILAAEHPRRVASMICLQATSRAPDLPRLPTAAVEVVAALAQAYESHHEAEQRVIRLLNLGDGSIHKRTAQEKRGWAQRLISVGYHPDGVSRQILAVIGTPFDMALLERIHVPTTVIQSRDDIFAPVEHGIDLARRIPHARLKIIEGAGHGLPKSLVPILGEAILDHLEWAINSKSSTGAQ